ncbi:MAG: nuclease-related domain-containing protein [Nocardioidaceae bacterium]
MDGVTVTRWRRYGKDRLYVTAEDGTRLGWHDLVTGEVHVERAHAAAVVAAAVAAWSSKGQLIAPKPVAEPDDEDLASREAGAMARTQAQSLKDDAPVRTFLARALGIHSQERAWRIGAQGEEMVAARLATLVRKDPRWRCLHAIPVGTKGSDIDHLVIGPGGVYTLNAKHHPRAKVWVGGDVVMVNGQRLPYVRNSRHEAARASRLLSAACGFDVPVRGVVVLVGTRDVTVKRKPGDIHIVERRRLTRWLRSRNGLLDATALDAVHDAARRAATWR